MGVPGYGVVEATTAPVATVEAAAAAAVRVAGVVAVRVVTVRVVAVRVVTVRVVTVRVVSVRVVSVRVVAVRVVAMRAVAVTTTTHANNRATGRAQPPAAFAPVSTRMHSHTVKILISSYFWYVQTTQPGRPTSYSRPTQSASIISMQLTTSSQQPATAASSSYGPSGVPPIGR